MRAESAMLDRAKNVLAHLREKGPRATARYAAARLWEGYYEWRFDVRTRGYFTAAQLGNPSPHADVYYPSDYRCLFRALRQVPIDPQRDVFLDFGCGMGRALVVASTFPFRRVVGVEWSPQLAAIARDNLRRAKRARCRAAEVIVADAAAFAVPSDASVLFLYAPFDGPVLEAALQAIQRSLAQAPRRMTVIFKNPAALTPLLDRHPWLVKRDEFPAAYGRHSIFILEARPPAAPA
jgi:SAM-dependent methyltransferase